MFVQQLLNPAQSGPATLPPDARLPQAAILLRQNGASAVVVHDGHGEDEPLGIVTERNLVDGLAHYGEAARLVEVGFIMNREFITCRPDDALEEVLQRMTAKRRRHVLVCKDGQLLGVLSIDSLLLFLLEQEQLEKDLLRQYFLGLGYH